MSMTFYLGDLTGCTSLEATIDALTNLAVDGASDFLVASPQLPFLAEMTGLQDQDRHLWLQLGEGDPLPSEPDFPGWVVTGSRAFELLEECPERLGGRRLILRPEEGIDVLDLVHRLRELAVLEIALEVQGSTPQELLTRALEIHQETRLPLHLRTRTEVDEGGLEETAMALGYLLEKGIAHSLSLAATWERPGSGLARSLLNALELRRFGINYVSCPTCGRCRVDLEAITNEVKERTRDIQTPLTVAIMGCEVNGPGEARHADVGIASGTESGLLIENGEAVAKYRESELVDVLVDRIRKLSEQMEV